MADNFVQVVDNEKDMLRCRTFPFLHQVVCCSVVKWLVDVKANVPVEKTYGFDSRKRISLRLKPMLLMGKTYVFSEFRMKQGNY